MRRTAALLLLLTCAPARAQQKTVHFNTKDGCRIEAFYLAPSSGAYVFINTHGLGSAKYEWGPLQDELKKHGYGYLSLDLRGHGASRTCGKKPVDYKTFTKAGWSRLSGDIEAASAWLKKKGIPGGRTIFCGASIGANLSLKAAAEGRIKPRALVLLSPGLDYAGVRAGDYLPGPGRLPVLISAAADDAYAWQSGETLAKAARGRKQPVTFLDGGSGHGVNMFKTPATIPAILAWAAGL
ncbi:MAG: hypothetical protein COT18_01175 [Elusimicrobia bacterium CG08_land_8_20_14_0_20_59_10]|nr:MAG: hypothetical protein COT18_01175 [Elusimicrobia bacterium CG08_land_8_20_14_0_20_59_10]